MRVAIFKPGTHTSAQGHARTWTDDDCANMVQAYNEQPAGNRKDAPLVLGHPKDNSPAFGWVKDLEYDGQHVWANLRDVATEFKEWIEKGLYGPVSPSLRADGTLKHVGTLGATPPAIGGLPGWVFSEEDGDETYEFSDFRVNDVAAILRRLREHLIATVGLEAAEQAIPAELLDRLANEPYDETQWMRQEIAELRGIVESRTCNCHSPSFSEDPMNNGSTGGGAKPATDNEQPKEQSIDFSEQLAKLERENAELQTTVTSQNQAIATLLTRQQESDFSEFLNSPDLKGRIVPGNRSLAMSLLKSAASVSGDIEYAEGDETKTGSALDAAKAQIRSWPQLVDFSEVATNGAAAGSRKNRSAKSGFEYNERDDVDTDRASLHERALAIAAEKTIDYSEALIIARSEEK